MNPARRALCVISEAKCDIFHGRELEIARIDVLGKGTAGRAGRDVWTRDVNGERIGGLVFVIVFICCLSLRGGKRWKK